MARVNGEMISRAFNLQGNGLSQKKIQDELGCKNIAAYLRLRPILEKGEMPPDKGSEYSLPACKDFIEHYMNKPNCAVDMIADVPVSGLSAKDKKELAMYAIDQHYFFLKQLTGVI